MALTDEEQRALDYQARQRRIAANQRAAAARLTGDGAYRRQIQKDWAPLILARREAETAWRDDPDCEEDDDE